MGCGASAGESDPVAPEDPMVKLLKQIHEKQSELKPLVVVLENESAEARYVKTSIMKCQQVSFDMNSDLEKETGNYEDIKDHIAEQDSHDLREASVGFGTDESKMGNIVISRLPENMTITDAKYQKKYNRTLEDQIRGENKSLLGLMTGSLTYFGRFLCYRCMLQPKRDAFLIHKAMNGMGCSDKILVEVLSTRTNDELKAAAEWYASEHDGEDMVERIKSETGGFGKKWYGKWVDTLVEFDRDESVDVPDNVEELAQQLYEAGEAKWMGCDEQPFIDILCKANEPTCMAIAEAYEALPDSKKTLAKAVEDKMGGDLEYAVLARVRTKDQFMAIRIFKACKGWGTDEECIGRVLACLSKGDAQELERFYNEFYAEEEEEPFNSLRSLLESELSGSFLEAIIGVLDTQGPKGHCRDEWMYPRESSEAATSFQAEVEEAYNKELAQYKGKEDMNGPFELVGVEMPYMRVEPYDYDIEAPEPPFEDKDRSELFPEDPTDEASAEKLLNQLSEAISQVQAQTQGAVIVKEAMLPAYFKCAHDLRYTDYYLGQVLDDNRAMGEFCASRDADYVHEASEGWGTDEDKLIRVLCGLSKTQLLRVDEIYAARYGSSLREKVDGELGGFFEGSFKYFMKCVLTPNAALDAELLKEAMEGWGTNDTLLCEIICTRSSRELRAAAKIFADENGKSLHQWIDGDTSGTYQDFLLACLHATRREDSQVDEGAVDMQVELLWGAGLNGEDKETNVFKTVLSKASEAQINAIKEKFESKYGKTMADAIKEHMGGDWERALLARIMDKPTYYADALQKAFKGWGTDEKATSRILGRNGKAEIKKIAARYEEMYGVSLHDAISSETSGNYKKALLTMLFAEPPGEAADPGED